MVRGILVANMRPSVTICEGTCGSGKTTLLRAAEAMFTHRDVSVLSQRTTYAPIATQEDDGTLDDASNCRALEDIVGTIRDHVQASRRVLVDTLHATHFVRAGVLTVESFVAIDRTLHELGALVVVLRVDAETIRARTIVGRRDSPFSRYARKFGATEEERLQYFVQEQERLVALLATHSCLPHVVLDGTQPIASLVAELHHAARSNC
jgi:thymidylate kinase